MDTSPKYSPDGKSILFHSTRSGDLQIWVCDSEGHNPMQLNDRRQRVDGGKLLMARLEFALDLAVSFLFAFMHDLKSTFVPSNATHPTFMAPVHGAEKGGNAYSGFRPARHAKARPTRRLPARRFRRNLPSALALH